MASSLFNPFDNRLALLTDGEGCFLVQVANGFTVETPQMVIFCENIEIAMNQFAEFCALDEFQFDELSPELSYDEEEIISFEDAFDTSGEALDWDEVNTDLFGNEVDFNDQQA